MPCGLILNELASNAANAHAVRKGAHRQTSRRGGGEVERWVIEVDRNRERCRGDDLTRRARVQIKVAWWISDVERIGSNAWARQGIGLCARINELIARGDATLHLGSESGVGQRLEIGYQVISRGRVHLDSDIGIGL